MDAREAMAAARRITVLTGAGVSTDSGIPDFRGPSGLWTALGREFTLDGYLTDPAVRRAAWRSRLRHPMWTAEPNAAHRALAGLERAGRVRALLTQNVDGLHQRAGSSAVVELHGSLFGTVCVHCGAVGAMSDALARVGAGEDDPDCLVCGGVLRSTTVAFGQALDAGVLRAARTAALDCELMLVAGTSLLVEPAAGLVGLAARTGAAVVICNAEPTPYDGVAAAVVRGPVGESLPELVSVPVVESGPLRTWGDPSTW
ncbi:NAD-dependent deacetylase [Saccharothrix tamanrassetensis]|uniref:protein acetyllysine N-acetyltransferase n=1 Tax=Saccharothrix tamanrassetensis TaxID=1051531 RepID=A0A841C6N6_9PSEU|nr:Sir2 family NAD-dependent protein deacetylase [Saccharothrix tamanrassetensis]MBB5954192.1 NAD-dependent deacetylase [Saccharothrix tamanrassetensis]